MPPPPPVPRAGRQRKRKDPDVVDERTARLQKRMVKNRESAARSRQRKQQYTAELETQARLVLSALTSGLEVVHGVPGTFGPCAPREESRASSSAPPSWTGKRACMEVWEILSLNAWGVQLEQAQSACVHVIDGWSLHHTHWVQPFLCVAAMQILWGQ